MSWVGWPRVGGPRPSGSRFLTWGMQGGRRCVAASCSHVQQLGTEPVELRRMPQELSVGSRVGECLGLKHLSCFLLSKQNFLSESQVLARRYGSGRLGEAGGYSGWCGLVSRDAALGLVPPPALDSHTCPLQAGPPAKVGASQSLSKVAEGSTCFQFFGLF